MSLDESDPAMSSSNEGSNNNNNKTSKKTIYETSKTNKTGNKSENNNKQTVGSNKKADRPETEAEKVAAAETESESSPVSRTVTEECSLCGKQFGRNSIQFHQRQCQRKQQVLKEKQEQDDIEERKMASYIIEEDVGKGLSKILMHKGQHFVM